MADTADMEEGEGNGEGAGADASAGEEGTSGAIRNYGLIVLGTVLRFMIPSWDLAWENYLGVDCTYARALSLRDVALKQGKTFDETLKMKSVSHYITKSRVVTASINRVVPFLHAPSLNAF